MSTRSDMLRKAILRGNCGISRRCLTQFSALRPLDTYERRHIGPQGPQVESMLSTVGSATLDDFVGSVIPKGITTQRTLNIEPSSGFTESEVLARLHVLASKNDVSTKSLIGRGYYGTHIPPVIQRNLLENPQWYTSYTPYQAEVSQGRLESLLNFQTLITELTGMDVANASLLDEGSAAAEAMVLSFSTAKKRSHFYVDPNTLPQTKGVLMGRAKGLGITVSLRLPTTPDEWRGACGILLSYPGADGSISGFEKLASVAHDNGATVCAISDLLALTVLAPPKWADVVVGSAQRFGVPMGYGGPHAAFFAARDKYKRRIPGRLVGVTKDRLGNRAFRLALQTREQHIRRDKATSNICTAQALLANISAMYACYHGPQGLRDIATRVHSLTAALAEVIEASGYELVNKTFFDTLTIRVPSVENFLTKGLKAGFNFYAGEGVIGISLDETVTAQEFQKLCSLFGSNLMEPELQISKARLALPRDSAYLEQPVFNSFHSETEMLRYLNHLQSKDISLASSMIPLGSCTMKLNAAVTMQSITWPEFSSLHPMVPKDQAKGYLELINELESDLAEITGFSATSLQPNSGAQGEYTGLRVIRAYQSAINEAHRNVCLIPVSAHGTNPASAAVAGMKIVVIKCLPSGELDLEDLETKAEKHAANLSAFMVTYPSTFGVYEPGVRKAIEIVHKFGGQVYMDGANMNAQVGLTSPGELGADVCHLNLHKTFCIPHGGGGPGVGPVCVRAHLSPYLPEESQAIEPTSSAPYGSASILGISWAYIKLMGSKGLKNASIMAMLNANYMAARLRGHYELAYDGRCAHEFILDLRPFKSAGVEAADVAKRLQDYGFHAPTMSWPVAGTLMVEPTESESKAELDRFCDAMISIRKEIQDVVENKVPMKDSVLANAPHTAEDLLQADWNRPYSRKQAAYPLKFVRKSKFWPTVTRVDDSYGDMNLFCTCSPVEEYADQED